MGDGCCASEIAAIKEEIEKSMCEVKQLKDKYKNLLIKNFENDLQIGQLKKEIEAQKYCSFENTLSKSCIEKLRSTNDSEKDDFKFISIVLNEIYDEEILKSKTISGRSKNHDKTALTPEKKILIEKVYSERLQHLLPAESSARMKNLSRIIRLSLDVANRRT